LIESLLITASQPTTLLLLVALIAMLESLAFVGLLIPGIALLLGSAALAGQQQVAIHALLLAGFLGACAGDLVSFFLGRYAAPKLLQTGFFQQHANWLQRSHHFFQHYGWMSVFIGRFIGPVRPVLPFIAGMSGMPKTTYISISLLAGLAWAPFYLLPGYLLGYGSHWLPELKAELSTLLSLTLFALLVLLFSHHGLPTGGWLGRWTSDRNKTLEPDPREHCVLYGLGFLACLFLLKHPWVMQWNADLSSLLFTRESPANVYWLWLTHLADPLFALVTILLLGNWTERARISNSALMAVLLFSVIFICQLIKWIVAEPRPESSGLASFSFPSSHAAIAAYLWGVISFHARYTHAGIQHRWIHWLGLSLIVLIALSRVALGYHWPLDVIAGVLTGATGTALYRWFCRDLPACRQGSVWLWVIAVWILGYPSIRVWLT